MNRFWTVSNRGYVFCEPTNDDSGWAVVLNELEILYFDEKADRVGKSYIISHDVAPTFNREERELLRLPKTFPYYISIRSHGDMGNNEFKYIVEFLRPDKTVFINPKIVESYIAISDGMEFMFDEAQYMLVKITEKCNAQVGSIVSRTDAISFNLEHMAKIKEYSLKVQALLDSYLQNEKVISPDKMTISVQRNSDGSYYVKPILLKKAVDGFVPTANNDNFHTVFNRRNIVSNTYVSKDGTKYVLSPELKDGLTEIKKYQRMDEEQAERVVKQPKEILDSDVFIFDLKYYADRVEKIGEFIRKSLPYVPFEQGGWLPEEGTSEAVINLEEKEPLTINVDNVKEIQLLIAEANDNGLQQIKYNGSTYDLTPKLVKRVDKVYKESKGIIPKSNQSTSEEENKEVKKSNVLLIKDNLEELNFKSESRSKETRSTITEDIFGGLNEGIHLYKHQKSGVNWMLSCWLKGYRGVLLADDMGLGKTMQAFAFISGLKLCHTDSDMKSVLIVAPVSLLRNWKDEYLKFVKQNLFSDVVEIYGSEINHYRKNGQIDFSCISLNKIVLTTYDTLRNYQLSIGKVEWSVMIIDEAQKIKNPTTMISMAAKGMQYDFAIALTGTPVENSWVDIWSIMDFVVPGRLSSLKEFTQQYQSKLVKVKDNQVALEGLGNQLKKELEPLFLRRMKKDYLQDLPQKSVKKIRVEMPTAQKKAYEAVIRSAHQIKTEMKKTNALQIIAQLRDVSLCPNLSVYNDYAFADKTPEEIINSSGRLMETFRLLKDIQKRDEKVLVFVTSRKMQRILRHLIIKMFKMDVPVPINGELMSERRQEIVSEFNNAKGFGVLILSAEAGGVGFNITAANNVIHLSRCWNPAKEDQATDRVYRIGQKKDVNVYIPITYDPMFGDGASFDEKLDNLLDFKRNLSESVMFPTGDSEEDGFKILDGIMSDTNGNEVYNVDATDYWTIDEMVHVTGHVFELIICDLYNNMEKYSAMKTPDSNDNGADVIALYMGHDNEPGLLIQCKQTATNSSMGPEGVAEVCSAIKYYEDIYHCKFRGVVVTNALLFTENAYGRANANEIELVDRNRLAKLLEQFPVQKRFL